MSGDAAPAECLLVFRNINVVQLNGPHHGVQAHRNQALLPGVTQHEHVGINGVAKQLLGQFVRGHRRQVLLAYNLFDGIHSAAGVEIGVTKAHEIRSGHLRGVEYSPRVVAAVGC